MALTTSIGVITDVHDYLNRPSDERLKIFSVEQIENTKQIEGVSTDDLCRLIRESMTIRRKS